MARVVYACRFDIPGHDSLTNVFEQHYCRWITSRYDRSHNTAISLDIRTGEVLGSLPDKHLLTLRPYSGQTNAIEIDWAYPGTDGLLWRSVARAAQLPTCCAVEHRVELSSAEYLVAPAHFSVGAPTVVRDICASHEVRVGKMTIRGNSYPLDSTAVDEFIQLLTSDERRLPIILLTPFTNGDRCDLESQELAERLAGVAIVTEAVSPEITRSLSTTLGDLGCYDGGARIYWPGFKISDELRSHPLILSSRIATIGARKAARHIENSIFSVAAFRFGSDPRIDSIISEIEAAERTQRAAQARDQGELAWEAYALEISRDLEITKNELLTARTENANLRENQRFLLSFESESTTDDEQVSELSPERQPKTVLEAVEFAKDDCKRLDFISSAFSSSETSSFRRPQEIYDDLRRMDKVADAWARNPGSGDLRLMLIEGGLGKRVSNFISQTTKGKWRQKYTFQYDGKSQLFEWHVTLGSGSAEMCASIHFIPDSSRGVLVIGHVGRHIRNTRT